MVNTEHGIFRTYADYLHYCMALNLKPLTKDPNENEQKTKRTISISNKYNIKKGRLKTKNDCT